MNSILSLILVVALVAVASAAPTEPTKANDANENEVLKLTNPVVSGNETDITNGTVEQTTDGPKNTSTDKTDGGHSKSSEAPNQSADASSNQTNEGASKKIALSKPQVKLVSRLINVLQKLLTDSDSGDDKDSKSTDSCASPEKDPELQVDHNDDLQSLESSLEKMDGKDKDSNSVATDDNSSVDQDDNSANDVKKDNSRDESDSKEKSVQEDKEEDIGSGLVTKKADFVHGDNSSDGNSDEDSSAGESEDNSSDGNSDEDSSSGESEDETVSDSSVTKAPVFDSSAKEDEKDMDLISLIEVEEKKIKQIEDEMKSKKENAEDTKEQS